MEQLRQTQMTEEEDKNKTQNFEGEVGIALSPNSETLPSTEFVKVEKNLASLGFFTPSSKRLWNAEEKTFTITTISDGKRLELRGTIIPSAKYGLPITADQDKWIALCKILTDILQKEGRVDNPVSFTSAEILRLLRKHRHSGKNYRDVEEWLDVLYSTTIFSEGVVYLANEKRRVKDRFRVFERAVSLGKELPDGRVADKNYVWFSDWQLQNINSNHLLPIDLEAYRELKSHIAKALVPLLQIWLYASRDAGLFEKRYDELCQILNIQQYKYFSLIKQKLAPALDELKHFGYLADWQVEKTSDGQNYKILFYHGEKFHRDRRARLARRADPVGAREVPSSPKILPARSGNTGLPEQRQARTYQRSLKLEPVIAINEEFLTALAKRGVTEARARKILAGIDRDQPVLDQLEWGDSEIAKNPSAFRNPAGFYVSLVIQRVLPPPTFETSAKRLAREEAERRRRDAWEAEQERLAAEEQAEEQKLDDLQVGNPERYQALFCQCEDDIYREFPSMKHFGKPDNSLHVGAIRSRMKRLLRQLTPEQGSDEFYFSKSIAALASATLAPADAILETATPIGGEPADDKQMEVVASDPPVAAEDGEVAAQLLPTPTEPAHEPVTAIAPTANPPQPIFLETSSAPTEPGGNIPQAETTAAAVRAEDVIEPPQQEEGSAPIEPDLS